MDAHPLPELDTGACLPEFTEAALREAMDASDSDVAAGRIVPADEVLAELDAIADRMEARRSAREA